MIKAKSVSGKPISQAVRVSVNIGTKTKRKSTRRRTKREIKKVEPIRPVYYPSGFIQQIQPIPSNTQLNSIEKLLIQNEERQRQLIQNIAPNDPLATGLSQKISSTEEAVRRLQEQQNVEKERINNWSNQFGGNISNIIREQQGFIESQQNNTNKKINKLYQDLDNKVQEEQRVFDEFRGSVSQALAKKSDEYHSNKMATAEKLNLLDNIQQQTNQDVNFIFQKIREDYPRRREPNVVAEESSVIQKQPISLPPSAPLEPRRSERTKKQTSFYKPGEPLKTDAEISAIIDSLNESADKIRDKQKAKSSGSLKISK